MRLLVACALSLLLAMAAFADEAPIAGTIKTVDVSASTITVAAAKGKMRIDIGPGSGIVRFARTTEPGKRRFVERPAALADLKPGWSVSVRTRHEAGREVAGVVRVEIARVVSER